VQAFAYFKEVINQHNPQLSSVPIQQAYANNVLVSSSGAASKEANCIGCQLYKAFFLVQNMSCLGFFCSDGTSMPVTPTPCDHEYYTIMFVQFKATVAPAPVSSDLQSIPAATVAFFLKLPQSPSPAEPPSNAVAAATKIQANLDAATTASSTAARDSILQALADGGTIADLDLKDPAISSAIAVLISLSSPAAGSPVSPPLHLTTACSQPPLLLLLPPL
jgi:hypothetical protein